MLGKVILGAIVGGIIIFAWGAISWMVLPWHTQTLHTFKDETAVSQAITANAPQSGVYFMPTQQMQGKPAPANTPMIFASVDIKGMPASMTKALINSFFIQVLAAGLVTLLLLHTRQSYLKNLVCIVIFALAAGVATYLPYWNWFGFATDYTLVSMADLLIGWFLAGLFIARIVRA